MTWTKHKINLYLGILSLGIAFIGICPKSTHAGDSGGKGAQIYCYMRMNGNEHEVSWDASYAVIKRQTNSLFKTSPKHAAVMIAEAVVHEPSNYPECGRYLGDLFGGSRNNNAIPEKAIKQNSKDRYSY